MKKKKDCRQLVKKRDGNSSPNDDMSELKCGNGGEMISRKKVFLSFFFFLVLLARSSVITSCASAWLVYMYTHNATMKEVVSLFNCPALALAQRRKETRDAAGRAGWPVERGTDRDVPKWQYDDDGCSAPGDKEALSSIY